jgi:hypothetical protein
VFEAEDPAAGHDRDLGGHQLTQQRVAGVRGDEQDAVDVAAAEVGDRALPLLRGGGDHQDQGEFPVGQRLGDAAQQDREVGVLEEQMLRLGQQERDRTGLSGGQRTGVRVGGVSGAPDRLADRADRLGTDPLPAVEDPGDGGVGDPGLASDVADGGPLPARTGRGWHCRDHSPLPHLRP